MQKTKELLERSSRTFRSPMYPETCNVTGPNLQTVDFIKSTSCRTIAEIGVENRIYKVKARLNAAGYKNIIAHGNARKTYDSYNWSLMRLLQEHDEPIFDYVFLEGAHTWHVDALAFLLIDRLLKVGGYIDFDDYYWTIRRSPTMNPKAFAATKRMYTKEQIRESHVNLIVDLLVKRDPRYAEVIENKIYKKTA